MNTHHAGHPKPASGNKGAFPSPLIQYLTFLLLKEVEPIWDTFLVEQMSSFYERFSWAYEKQNPNDIMVAAIQDAREYTARKTGRRISENVEFLTAYNWKKLYPGYGDIDDTNPVVPYIDLTIGDYTKRICLRNAHIEDDLIQSDAAKVYIAVDGQEGPYGGLLVISKLVYELFGDEPDGVRFELASEFFNAPSCIRDLLLHPEYLNEIARTLAYLSTFSTVSDGLTDEAIAEACRKANHQRICQIAADAVPELLELLGFLSPSHNGVRDITEAFLTHRLLFSAFGACVGCSYWADKKMNSFDAITENFSYQIARNHLSLLCDPETAEKLLEPLLLTAEHRPEELEEKDRKLLFDYMVQALEWEHKDFPLRIAAALFAEDLTAYEAGFFIEADPDEQSDELMELINTGFRTSVQNPQFYYPYALQVILKDEPAFASSLGLELALDTRADLKVLGYAILGTLAKAFLERWNLPDLMRESITNEAILSDLFSLAASRHSAQGFYQKMLSNLVCAGFLKTSPYTCPPVQGLPRQYRDPWLSMDVFQTIGFFPREYYFLDNFSAYQIQYEGILYPTVEHAYQAQKFLQTAQPEIAELIRTAPSPHAAKKIAAENQMACPPDWDARKLLVMENLLRAKLHQHPYVRQKLLETGTMPIVEDSPYDYYWGIGFDRTGENHLGKIWMKLRAELRAES